VKGWMQLVLHKFALAHLLFWSGGKLPTVGARLVDTQEQLITNYSLGVK
jgi:hypothetical protein